jgi:acyl-CoA reductase-like NAD-dependent aldehyde dehydrogenase
MVTNPDIEIITFTGGVAVGKLIAAQAGFRRAALELGGNDPLIVCDDLASDDLERAAELAVQGATRNSGQRCTAVKRILVMEKVADEFASLVEEKARRIVFGDPMDAKTDLGTVVSEEAAKTFEKRALEAADRGARILYHPGRMGAVLPPITLDLVPPDCALVCEETFGPVIPMIRVAGGDEDVIRLSNSAPFGLSSGVCTNRLDRMTRYIDGLQVGTVNIWEVPGYRIEMSPFGGIKDSGNGIKEGVLEAMKFFTNVKTYSLPWPA